MALFDGLTKRVEQRARDFADRTIAMVEAAAAEFPDVTLHREGDELVIAGRGLTRRWFGDVRLRLAWWRQG